VRRLVFVLPDGRRREVAADESSSLMETARAEDLVEGACDGSLACATCHILLDAPDFDRLPPPSYEEADLLEFATGVGPTSRLGCQIRIGDLPDGASIRLPLT
jgi:2Fe-2S ferredoxin